MTKDASFHIIMAESLESARANMRDLAADDDDKEYHQLVQAVNQALTDLIYYHRRKAEQND